MSTIQQIGAEGTTLPRPPQEPSSEEATQQERIRQRSEDLEGASEESATAASASAGRDTVSLSAAAGGQEAGSSTEAPDEGERAGSGYTAQGELSGAGSGSSAIDRMI